MKSPEYVAIVTSIYRRALDSIARGSWSASVDDERDLALAFNRDFTEGHLLGAKDVMGRKASDNQGFLMGSVASYDSQRGEAVVRLSGPLAPEKGDGLVIQAPGQETGMVVQSAFQKDGLLRLKTPERVRPGARVYLTGSTALARKAQAIVNSGKAEIPIDLAISFEDGYCRVEGRLVTGERVEVKADFRMEKAKKQPITRQQIESQLRRTGGTPFVIGKIDMDYPGDLFAPLGALNQLRRDLLDKATQTLLEKRRPTGEKVARARDRLKEMELNCRPIPGGVQESRVPTIAVYADSLETLEGAIQGGCSRIYFEPLSGEQKDRSRWIREKLDEARAICRNAGRELVWKWPKITGADFLDGARRLINEVDVDGIMVENVGDVQAVMAAQPKARIYGASGLNVWNHLTMQSLASHLQRLTLSPELSRDQLACTVAAARQTDGAPELELMVQGNLEVMVTEDCVPNLARRKPEPGDFWGLQDFKRIFPLRLDEEGRTHIFNSTETCLLDLMPDLFRIGLDGIAIDARGRTRKYALEMTEIYQKAIELTNAGGASQEGLQALKEYAKARSLGGITTGHFLRGLKEELS
jgi:putative protease